MSTPCPLAVLALALVLGACSGASGEGSAVPAASPGASPAAPGSTGAAASRQGPVTPAGLYRDTQAESGRQVFRESCAECHYSSEMRGTQFQFEWERRTVGDLYEHLVKTMPEDAPGSLPTGAYVDVVAYILRLNGFPAGDEALGSVGPAMEASLAAPSGGR